MLLNLPFRRTALACAAGMVVSCASWAQSVTEAPTTASPSTPSTATPSTATTATPQSLPPVVVTGNPLGSRELAAPVSVLAGDELVLKRGSTLGDTLNGQPGVSSTYFGPNANRPIVRGLDGDRVRVMSNAGASLDASSLSFDHAVPIDPLIVERLEVLRGPGALLYGGSAVGGVVNALDNRIPRQRLDGVSGAMEARLGGAEHERGGAALVEAGNGRAVLHADVFGRDTRDLRVPEYTPKEDGAELASTRQVRNSASRSHGGALGGSLFFDQGYLGLSADTYDSRYGVVAEPDVTIDMKRDHVGLAGELKFANGPWRGLRAQANHTNYEHKEIEGTGEVGTIFKTSGDELRLEAEHAPLGPVKGVLGVQAERFDFSALGDEAFVPTTRTRRNAVFALEELPWAAGTTSLGLRLERARVASDGDADPASGGPFGAASERRFSLSSASLAHVARLTPAWSLTGSLSLSERAPTSFELYANGLHAATGAYERGDSTLQTERGTNLDLAAEWKQGDDRLRVGVFHTRFSRYIALDASGNTITVDGEEAPEYLFRSVRARLNGVEIDGKHRLWEQAGWRVEASGKLDFTRGTNLDSGEPLPRVAPLRATLGVDVSQGPWGARAELEHAARQNRVSSTDVPTDGYTLANLSFTRHFDWSAGDALWFVKITNLGDTLAYSASTVQTVRDLAPLPGRAVRTGIRVTF